MVPYVGTNTDLSRITTRERHHHDHQRRGLGAIVQTMALAKGAGVDTSEALKLVDWEG